MLIVSRTRLKIVSGQIIFKTHDPLYYAHYDPWIVARGRVLWVNYEEGMACVEWLSINDNPPTEANRYSTLGSYDLDKYDTHYCVSTTIHTEHLWPVWLTPVGLDGWNNFMFRYMR